MEHTQHNPRSITAPIGNYSHGIEVNPGCRYLFISGQIPELPNGSAPTSFEEQCHAVWDNIFAVLASANMQPKHLVKVTTFLTHADQVAANSQIRQTRLGNVQPAITVVIVQTLESKWLLEIEAIAAATP
jgi:enamine deaminase RidA (YjgF/YER057c/UK114 family)